MKILPAVAVVALASAPAMSALVTRQVAVPADKADPVAIVLAISTTNAAAVDGHSRDIGSLNDRVAVLERVTPAPVNIYVTRMRTRP